MANYQLGPVIGKIGGVEIITEQAEVGRDSSRSWSLPEGWEEGYIGADGTPTNHASFGTPYVNMFGSEVNANRDKASGFQPLTSSAVISTEPSASWSGTVTLIRTA